MRGGVRESGTWSSRRIPESWDWVSFEVLFGNTTSSDLKLPRKHYLPEGSIPVVDQGEGLIGGYTENANLVNPTEPPALVFGDHTRAVKYVPFQFVQGADGVKVLKPAETLDPKYAYWALRTIRLPDKGYARHFRFLRASEFPVAPLPEQRRIVAKIEELFSELDAGVAALERAQSKLERYRASVLKAAVEGWLTEQWRKENPPEETGEDLLKRILTERRKRWEEEQLAAFEAKGTKPPAGWREKYKEPEGPDTSGLPELPEGWCWASLDQSCPVFVDCEHRTPRYSSEGIPALRPRDVVGGCLLLHGAAKVSDQEYTRQTRRRAPVAGDIVYSRELSFGWASAIPSNLMVCLSQGMVLFRPGAGVSSEYLALTLNSPWGRRQAVRAAIGSAHPHINLRDIRSFLIPVPPPREQGQIVRTVKAASDGLMAVGRDVTVAQDRVFALRASILKLAFEGRLVPQDPNDEAASVLLERIRASRKAEKPGAKRPRKRKSSQGSLDL